MVPFVLLTQIGLKFAILLISCYCSFLIFIRQFHLVAQTSLRSSCLSFLRASTGIATNPSCYFILFCILELELFCEGFFFSR
jgi:hypothetical protein